MKSYIIEESKKLGIDGVGFTNNVNMNYLIEPLKQRIVNKYNCLFESDNIEERVNAKLILPNCKTIIACLFSYGEGYNLIKKLGYGNISVASYGMDYHILVKNKLQALVDKIGKKVKFDYSICVDTKPLNDRAILKNAGLGFIGKNSMLINDAFGSFVFLGYILTSLEIETNEIRQINKCGECNKCIRNCPNNAIKDGGIINANQCISYLTQTKEYIPFEYREKMGFQIYGCDVCQLSCPYNNEICKRSTSNDYSCLLIKLEDIINISKAEYSRKYGYIAGSWRGRNIWIRNAIIAIGNTEDSLFFDLIKKQLESENNMFKKYGAWALIKLGKKKGKDIILKKIRYECDEIKNEYKKLLEEL